jgi:glucan biosynthesis protein C
MGPIVHILFAQMNGETDVYNLEVIYPSTSGHLFRVSTIYVWFLYYLLLFSAIHLLIERIGIMRYLQRFNIAKNWFFASVLIVSLLMLGCLLLWQENSLFGDYQLNPALLSVGGYIVFYIFGIFLANRKDSFSELKRHGTLFVILGTLFFIIYSLQGILVIEEEGNAMKFNLVLMISSGLATVCYSFGFLGLALKYYTKPNRIVSYIGRSSYFLYLIHFPVLLVFLKFSIGYNWNVFVKFLFVLITTCIVSILLNFLWIKTWKGKPPI